MIIDIFTDGGCEVSRGRGGAASILVSGQHRKELSQGYTGTTNNRMEIRAAINALKAIRCPNPEKINIHSDSRYVVDSFNLGWARKWRQNKWMRNKKEPALNTDLWAELLDITEGLPVEFHWVKGHSGHFENERCDQLATEAIKNGPWIEDEQPKPLESNLSLSLT